MLEQLNKTYRQVHYLRSFLQKEESRVLKQWLDQFLQHAMCEMNVIAYHTFNTPKEFFTILELANGSIYFFKNNVLLKLNGDKQAVFDTRKNGNFIPPFLLAVLREVYLYETLGHTFEELHDYGTLSSIDQHLEIFQTKMLGLDSFGPSSLSGARFKSPNIDRVLWDPNWLITGFRDEKGRFKWVPFQQSPQLLNNAETKHYFKNVTSVPVKFIYSDENKSPNKSGTT